MDSCGKIQALFNSPNVLSKKYLHLVMTKRYSQLRAALALAKSSLLAMLRSPTSVVFSLLFPIIFIVVFGSMVDNSIVQLKLATAPGCNTNNVLYKSISNISNISITTHIDSLTAIELIKKGRLTSMLDIRRDVSYTIYPRYKILLTSSTSTKNATALLQTILNNTVKTIDQKVFPSNLSVASLVLNELPGRVYRQIDFILPGQLGFSLLMAGVFGSAFLLFNLRKSLVLKRLWATPISRPYIILGEMISRLFFHVISFTIMIVLGYFVFNFTLINGVFTFFEMLLFSLPALIIFMGIGFIISGVIENESSIAPIANTVTLPQILLCGLFFPVENFPHWLQAFCNLLPLTFFVDGLRKIAFEGVHIWQMPHQVFGITVWTIIIAICSIKFFKWE